MEWHGRCAQGGAAALSLLKTIFERIDRVETASAKVESIAGLTKGVANGLRSLPASEVSCHTPPAIIATP